MKMYKRIVIDMKSGSVIEADTVEYNGPVAECKGGGSTTTTNIDYKYNKRMAAVAERQQKISDEYFEFWKSDYKPYEQAQIAANMELMPDEIQTAKEEMAFKRFGMGVAKTELEQRAPVAKEYYKQALGGLDVQEEVVRARSDVAQGLEESQAETERIMSRMGVDPTSGRFASAMKTTGLDKARAIGGAMSGARLSAEAQNFERLRTASSTPIGGLNY